MSFCKSVFELQGPLIFSNKTSYRILYTVAVLLAPFKTEIDAVVISSQMVIEML